MKFLRNAIYTTVFVIVAISLAALPMWLGWEIGSYLWSEDAGFVGGLVGGAISFVGAFFVGGLLDAHKSRFRSRLRAGLPVTLASALLGRDPDDPLLVDDPRVLRDPSEGSPLEKDLMHEPPPGAEGLEFPCAHCDAEIVVYYLEPDEEALCPDCGKHTPVPGAAALTDKPSTMARAYGYGDMDPDARRRLPRSAERPEARESLPRAHENEDKVDPRKLPRKTKQ